MLTVVVGLDASGISNTCKPFDRRYSLMPSTAVIGVRAVAVDERSAATVAFSTRERFFSAGAAAPRFFDALADFREEAEADLEAPDLALAVDLTGALCLAGVAHPVVHSIAASVAPKTARDRLRPRRRVFRRDMSEMQSRLAFNRFV